MKILKTWLKDYIEFNYTDAELADKLSLSGTSVEGFESGLDENVIVAEIRKIESHPNADKLRLATVFDGSQELKIVCGAPNIEVGQKVPLAKIGTKLGDITIAKVLIRGVESSGMLCAADELGLGNDHSGIMILPPEYLSGEKLNSYLNKDTIFDIEVTANRGDCLSHIGIAREIAALSENSVRKEPISLSMDPDQASGYIKVEMVAAKYCFQYLARVVRGVKIAPSPAWLQDRLIACGAKPINNVVDITNFILLDLGQPLHAFDADKIDGKQIIVRLAKDKESIVTLDDTDRGLDDQTLVIADKKRPIAIAGIMGGANSEVDDKTTNIVIEAAEFEPVNIRKSAKRLNLATEASYRFERGIDSGGVEYAINKAAKMVAELCGGRILSGIVRVGNKPERTKLKIEYKLINNLLGLDLDEALVNRILKKLGFETDKDEIYVPLWRHDISIWQDLAEEVGRIYGYDQITPLALAKTKEPAKSDFYWKMHIKDILAESGLTENMSYSFLSAADIAAAKLKSLDLLEVANPLQPENKYMRSALLPGLLKAVAKNPSFDQIAFFEIGHVFGKKSEKTSLAIATAGKDAKKKIDDALLSLSEKINIKSALKPDELSREELQCFKVKKPVVYTFEIDLSDLTKNSKLSDKELSLHIGETNFHYRPISKFPILSRDLAFFVDDKVPADSVGSDIANASDLVNRVELFDEFASDKFGKGKKNVAYHIFLQHPDKTLVDKEADQVIKEIISTIVNKYKATLRDK